MLSVRSSRSICLQCRLRLLDASKGVLRGRSFNSTSSLRVFERRRDEHSLTTNGITGTHTKANAQTRGFAKTARWTKDAASAEDVDRRIIQTPQDGKEEGPRSELGNDDSVIPSNPSDPQESSFANGPTPDNPSDHPSYTDQAQKIKGTDKGELPEGAEGSIYDSPEFRTLFGNVLKGMEKRGEVWEEDGIAEMDREIEESARLEAATEKDAMGEEELEKLRARELEATVRAARNRFGDTLPEAYLSETEYTLYQRLYGSPSRLTPAEDGNLLDNEGVAGLLEDAPEKNALLREAADGSLEEVEYVLPCELDQIVDDDAELDEEDAIIDEQDDVLEEELTDVEDVEGVELEDPIFTQPDGEDIALILDEYATDKDNEPRTKEEVLEKVVDEWPGDEYVRTHPLTKAGRYGTNPSTLPLPRAAFVDPVQIMLAPLANKHLTEAAQKALGGVGIPYSPNTPRIGMKLEQQPIPITSFQTKMSEREADVYMAAVMPQTYASLMSVLVEVRKRLGGSWLQSLLKKEGGPLIMDAGSGGAGVLAWRELLRAEWEGMHKVESPEAETAEETTSPNALEEKPKIPPVPLGRSTVVTGSDALRHRASKLLENTTFIPRIPDEVKSSEQVGPQPRKLYDIILAPHTLWPIKEEYQRKGVVETLWSLLNPNGGILVILEKGVPRGFEVVAGAREMLLKRHISSPGSESYETPLDEQKWEGVGRWTEKEKGCIIAPCTNHFACPLYKIPGSARGRKDWCYFPQRYTRPPALMTILGAKARNHDDVEFSYVAVQRGRDQRTAAGDSLHGRGFTQGSQATTKALDGYGPRWSRDEKAQQISIKKNGEEEIDEEAIAAETEQVLETGLAPHPLSLPRTILSPLKRKGHILLDVCTPAGTYERWLVNKRNGKQVFRDARKAKWGDLWALGARSSSERRVQVGMVETNKKEGIKKDRKAGRKGLGKRGKGRWADGDGGKLGMGMGGKKGRGRDGVKKGVIVGDDE
jgi:ribosomal protein RSM22 (predicted rRNA methylase)